MKKRVRIFRGNLMCRVALISLTAGVLAGCSSALERFDDYDFATGAVSPASQKVAQPSFRDVTRGRVVAAAQPARLPPVSRPAPVQRSGNILPPVSVGSVPVARAPVNRAPVVRAPVTPVYRAPTRSLPVLDRFERPAVQKTSMPVAAASEGVSWRGWSSTGGTRVRLREGETIYTLSKRYGVPVDAVAAVNGIKNPGSVHAGQSIVVPTYVYEPGNRSSGASDNEGRVVHKASAPLPRARQVARGRVLPQAQSADEQIVTGSIPNARQIRADGSVMPHSKPRHQPSFAEITSGFTKTDANPIRVDVRPKTKPAVARHSAPQTVASVSGRVSETPRRKISTSRRVANTQPQPAPQETARANVSKPVTTGGPNLRWPVRGKVISGFGAKPGGSRNDGVNLSVPMGTPVVAADSGTVVYAGNELKGYGNLVLLRHDNGWVTAYAHNSDLKVQRGDNVRRGDVIAKAGSSGSVSQPQVHFELRKGNKPVDPQRYLPRG